jgi:hypothetical protein
MRNSFMTSQTDPLMQTEQDTIMTEMYIVKTGVISVNMHFVACE